MLHFYTDVKLYELCVGAVGRSFSYQSNFVFVFEWTPFEIHKRVKIQLFYNGFNVSNSTKKMIFVRVFFFVSTSDKTDWHLVSIAGIHETHNMFQTHSWIHQPALYCKINEMYATMNAYSKFWMTFVMHILICLEVTVGSSFIALCPCTWGMHVNLYLIKSFIKARMDTCHYCIHQTWQTMPFTFP